MCVRITLAAARRVTILGLVLAAHSTYERN